MQIDYHLGVTYVLSRLAGFNPQESNIIAGSSQFVDDAISGGVLNFTNRYFYRFLSSAHRGLDYRNFLALSNHLVWIPFHFIPGNEYDPGLEATVPEEVQRLICRPNSLVVQSVLNNCLNHHQKNFALYLLGVTSHSLVDTWSHQAFAGITHFVNEVSDIFDEEGRADRVRMDHRDKYFRRGLHRPFWRKIIDTLQSDFLNAVEPIGHGTVLSYPDLPYLKWKYKDYKGQMLSRNNPELFLEAAEHLFKFLIAFNSKHNNCNTKLDGDLKKIEKDYDQICKNTENFNSEEPSERLSLWRESILRGDFSYGNDIWNYDVEGPEAWICKAFGLSRVDEFQMSNILYPSQFMNSDWKLAQDALSFHQFTVLHEILPKFGICAA